MTEFQHPSFTVSQRGRDPKTCAHGWRTPKGVCVFCGASPEMEQVIAPAGSPLLDDLPSLSRCTWPWDKP